MLHWRWAGVQSRFSRLGLVIRNAKHNLLVSEFDWSKTYTKMVASAFMRSSIRGGSLRIGGDVPVAVN